jgi:hypothetical protein
MVNPSPGRIADAVAKLGRHDAAVWDLLGADGGASVFMVFPLVGTVFRTVDDGTTDVAVEAGNA